MKIKNLALILGTGVLIGLSGCMLPPKKVEIYTLPNGEKITSYYGSPVNECLTPITHFIKSTNSLGFETKFVDNKNDKILDYVSVKNSDGKETESFGKCYIDCGIYVGKNKKIPEEYVQKFKKYLKITNSSN